MGKDRLPLINVIDDDPGDAGKIDGVDQPEQRFEGNVNNTLVFYTSGTRPLKHC